VQAIPLTVSVSPGSSIVGFSGSVDTASTLTEIFLLECAEGMPDNQIGFGRVTHDQIAQLPQLHTLDFDLTDRTPYFAQAQGSNLLLHIRNTLNQAALGFPVDDAIGGAKDKVVMLVGHDDQLASVGGLLYANWQLPTFAWNDTPPGGAMVFELRQGSDGAYFVRLSYLCQTLDQMHNATVLSLQNPPVTAPIFIPGASGSDAYFDAPLADFNKVVEHQPEVHQLESREAARSLRMTCFRKVCYAGAMRRTLLTVFLCVLCFVSPLASFAQVNTDAVKRGRYLANEMGKCGDCHTPRTAGLPDKTRWLKGSPLGFKPISPIPGWAAVAPDLTATGPLWKSWGEKRLVQFFVKGVAPDGKSAGPPMPQYTLTDQDARAIVEYLKSLP
jgi:mono/diheme cytochrome c family protein